jgi:hypothetical protein
LEPSELKVKLVGALLLHPLALEEGAVALSVII